MNFSIKNSIIALLLGVFILACTSNTIYKKPKDLISKNQMADLLTDMYLATAAKNIKTKNLQRNLDYMPLVYEKYGIDSLRFQTSNLYYMSRIDDYQAIYKKVKTRLQKMLDTTQAAKDLKDSLKNKQKKRPELKKKEIPAIKKVLNENKPN